MSARSRRGWWRGLRVKLFASYLVVAVTGLLVALLAARLIAPLTFADHMQRMMAGGGMGHMMRPGGPFSADSPPPPWLDSDLAVAFGGALRDALLVSGAVAALVALLVSLFVAGRVVAPVRRLAGASRRLAAGHYAERVPAGGDDELGELAASFNELAGTLEATEQRRRALIGDVAHELRTPVTILEGNLEGLLDGVVEPIPATWARLHGEAGRLRRLIDDLQELSRAEAGQIPLTLAPLAPAAIARAALDRLADLFAERELSLVADLPADLPLVRADHDRAVQVLTNLLTNAVRATLAPGEVGCAWSAPARRSSSRSPTRASAWPPSICRTCSSASTGLIRRVAGRWAARASA
jgi:histidine kinase